MVRRAAGVVRSLVIAVALVAAARNAAAQAPSVSVGGTIYTHFGYQLDTDTSLARDGHRNNFDVNRSYLTLNGRSGIAQARITVDVDGRRAASNQQTFRLKYAYVAIAPSGSPFLFKLGAVQTPFIEYDEAMWGYRMQGSVAMDRSGYLTSSDYGASVDASWRRDAIQLQAGLFNGEGYAGAPGDQHKDIAGRVTVRLLRSADSGRTGGLRLTAFGLAGKRDGGGPRTRLLGMLSYKTPAITMAAQYAVTRDSLSPSSNDVEGRVMSAYATWHARTGGFGVIGRVDVIDPDTDREPADPSLAAGRQVRTIAGVSYQVTPNVRFLVDADLNSLRHGSPSPAFTATRRAVFLHAEYRF